jgi:hypothetical protein
MSQAIVVDRAEILYADVNLFVGQHSRYELIYNEDSINNSILAIVGTKRKTRVFNRAFGSDVLDLLWEPMDDRTITAIRLDLVQAIKDWEPRIQLQDVVVQADYVNQRYFVGITYIIPTLGNKVVTFTFNLPRKGA